MSIALTAEEKKLCTAINQLFDDMERVRKKRTWAIFSAVYVLSHQEAVEHHGAFLQNILTCPPEVLTYCRKELGYIVKIKS